MASNGNGHFDVNAMTDIAAANRWARAIEDREAARLGVGINDARASVARRLQVSPGTLENLRRLRLKAIPSWVMARIRAEFVSVLQREIQALEHEIQIARQTGADHSDDTLAKAEAQVVAARKTLMREATK